MSPLALPKASLDMVSRFQHYRSNYVDCMEIGSQFRVYDIGLSPMLITDNTSTGEDIDIKGPTGEITYLGKGKFKVNDDEFQFEKVRLQAPGSRAGSS